MLELLGTIGTVLAVVGVVLNNRLDRRCFFVWLVSNSIFAYLHLESQMISLVVRDGIFLLLAIHGFYHWKSKGVK